MKSDVPFLRESEIEAEAKLLLAEFSRDQRPIPTPPVPIDEIIELHLKLSFEIRDLRTLFGFGDVHGAIWFRDKLIAVDKQLDPDVFPVKRGRYHFTLAHETGHWRLHRHLYLRRADQPNLFADEDSKPNYVCRSSDAKVPVEFQADQFAAYLLMPRDLITQGWQDWRGNLEPIVLDDLKANRDQILADEMGRRGGFRADDDEMVLERIVADRLRKRVRFPRRQCGFGWRIWAFCCERGKYRCSRERRFFFWLFVYCSLDRERGLGDYHGKAFRSEEAAQAARQGTASAPVC